jgi:RNA polymerase sigma-70 factor (ECF subfamily)
MAIFADDRELLAAHLAGDSDAFDEIVREHRPALYRHALRRLSCEASAEDAVQETLVRAYKALPNFSGEYRLGPWLHRILQNVCADEGNRRRRDFDKLGRVAALPLERMDSPSVEEELHLDFDDSDLQEALKNLPDPYREALSMRYVDDLNYSQVSKAAGVSEQNARARVSRAKSYMKQSMRGLALLPVFLLGILKRGEKAVAAATSTGTATIAATSTSTVAASSQLASAGIPALAEAANVAAQAAPVAVPVIAKAVVGVGLVAALFAPAADSPVHLAVKDLASDLRITEVTIPDDSVISDDLVEVEVISQSLVNGTSGLEKQQDLIRSAVEIKTSVVLPEVDAPIEIKSEVLLVSNEKNNKLASDSIWVAGSLESVDVSIVAMGAGRYSSSGTMQISLGETLLSGQLGDATQIKVSAEADFNDRYRLDGLFTLTLDDGSFAEFRIAGFGTKVNESLDVTGLFRFVAAEPQMSEKGSFTGILSVDTFPALVSLSLTP